MAGPSDSKVQNILPVQALFNIDNSFNTFIGQGQPFIVSATESIGITDVTTLDATLYPTLSPVSTGQVTSLDVTSTKLTFNPYSGTLGATVFQGSLSGTASVATNLANGVAGNVVYQSALGTTAYVTNGSTGQVLTSNGSSAPAWSNPTSSIAINDDTSTNATRYPLFTSVTTGNISSEYTSSTKFQFNPSTGLLSATGFSGSGANLTSIPNGALVNSSVTIGSTSVSLGATVTTFADLTSVTSTTFVGALTGNASTATSATTATNATNVGVTDDTSTASSVYPTWVTNTTGNLPIKTASTKFSFVPSTGVLSVTGLSLTNALGISSGGTNGTATPTAGGVAYGSGTAYAFSAVGTSGQVLTSAGSGTPTWTTPATGTVTSVGGTGTVNGLTLTGTVTTTGNLTLGGTLDLSSPPAIGGTTASTGRFTTVTSTIATGTAPFTVASTTAVTNLSIGGNAGTVTNGVYTTDTGTVTNTMLAGSIANSKLSNSAITFGSTSQALGSTVSGISGVTIDNGAVGATTPAAVTATTLIGGGSSANYGQLTGGATTKAVEFKTLGSDTNVSLAVQPKGTGAIDLAAGSSGVNISNGGTVTAITRTAGGTGYTVAPTITISAPTTAGGVQATATCTVTAGVVDTAFTITNAGSGYVEQPTITFTPVSGGSGATAYATVGSGTVFKSIGTTSDFYTPSGIGFRITDASATSSQFIRIRSTTTGSTGPIFGSASVSESDVNLIVSSQGTGVIRFNTARILDGTQGVDQMRVSHTASAVNYVQVTGATTASKVVAISAQGSDTDVTLSLSPKGAGTIRFGTYTAGVLTPAGYITITDSGGTSRRLLVG